jgi:hypothetical protein
MFSALWKVPEGRKGRRPGRHLALEVLEDRAVPALLGNSLFPADNPWNQQITNAPVASNSAAIISNITSVYGNGRLHPDFGQDSQSGNDLYGIPYNVVHGNSMPKVHVVIDAYAGESDLFDAPVPANAVIEGDYQNGPKPGVDARGDSHLLIYDADNNVTYEFYRASRPSENTDGQWHADQESVWDMKSNSFRTLGYTSADAAGLPILPGLVRPDEGLPTSQGGQGVINHAIRFTLQNAIILNQYLYPASHAANPGNTNAAIMPPMGARFRLKASVDISQLNPEARIIAQAMKDYGMILADNGSNFYFSGASYSVDSSNNFALTWNDNDIQDTLHGLKSLHYGDFEVVDLTPAVTGLLVSSGTAGTTVTVVGRNFSGAAGTLQVLFGGTPATGVTVVDDNHVTALVPTGSGAVDVRVQSGARVPGHTDNIENPLFGYGISAITTADRFTYSSGTGNMPPTVVVAAAAAAVTTAPGSAALSVLGADNQGEANLIYTWSVVSAPEGSHPIFSASGTNAAKSITVTLDRAGAYIFRATITDSGSLSIASDVAVSVAAALPPPGTGSPPPSSGPSPSPGQSPSASGSSPPPDRSQTIGMYDNSGFNPFGVAWYLRSGNSPGFPDAGAFVYGAVGWHGIIGDWDGDGLDTIGVVNPFASPFAAAWALRNENGPGAPDAGLFLYGLPTWVPVVGDWFGVGHSGIGMYDPASAMWYLRRDAGPGAPDVAFQFGLPGWIPVVGDWDGGGKTEVGAFDPATATWYLASATAPGGLLRFQFGLPGWKPVTGDWNGDGITSVGLVDSLGNWYLRNSNGSGAVDIGPFSYGLSFWTPVAGHFPPGAAQFVSGPASLDGQALLTNDALRAMVAAALDRLRTAGADAALVGRLASANYTVGLLAGGLVGWTDTGHNQVRIDARAAGHGWFIDPTPFRDEEFADGVARPGSTAAGREDLLTVVLHEMGHLAGWPDHADGPGNLMDAFLAPGVRRTEALDTLFAGR